MYRRARPAGAGINDVAVALVRRLGGHNVGAGASAGIDETEGGQPAKCLGVDVVPPALVLRFAVPL